MMPIFHPHHPHRRLASFNRGSLHFFLLPLFTCRLIPPSDAFYILTPVVATNDDSGGGYGLNSQLPEHRLEFRNVEEEDAVDSGPTPAVYMLEMGGGGGRPRREQQPATVLMEVVEPNRAQNEVEEEENNDGLSGVVVESDPYPRIITQMPLVLERVAEVEEVPTHGWEPLISRLKRVTANNNYADDDSDALGPTMVVEEQQDELPRFPRWATAAALPVEIAGVVEMSDAARRQREAEQDEIELLDRANRLRHALVKKAAELNAANSARQLQQRSAERQGAANVGGGHATAADESPKTEFPAVELNPTPPPSLVAATEEPAVGEGGLSSVAIPALAIPISISDSAAPTSNHNNNENELVDFVEPAEARGSASSNRDHIYLGQPHHQRHGGLLLEKAKRSPQVVMSPDTAEELVDDALEDAEDDYNGDYYLHGGGAPRVVVVEEVEEVVPVVPYY